MYQPNYERIAHKIVHASLQVQPGQQVLIRTRNDSLHLAELVGTEVSRVGGVPTLLVQSDDLAYHLAMDTPLEDLPRIERAAIAAIRASDHYLVLGISQAEPARFVDIPIERERALEKRYQARREAIYEDPRRNCLLIDYPTRYMARPPGLSWERFFEMFWRAMDVDYETMHDHAAHIVERWSHAQEFYLTTAQGTRLRMRRGDRTVFGDTGMVRGNGNLPAGEVFFAPIEESVEGHLVIDFAFYQGERLTGLEFRFENGIATPLRARSGFETFQRVWEIATGDKDRLAELGIGLNSEVHTTLGSSTTDEKAFGIVHLALGRNGITGGKNKSSLRWSMFLSQPTLLLDGQLFLDRGQFVGK